MDTSIIILLLLVMGVIFMYLDIRRPNSFISRFLDRKHGEQWFVDRDSEEWNGNDVGENLVYTDITKGPFMPDKKPRSLTEASLDQANKAIKKLEYEYDMYQKMKDDDMAFQEMKLKESVTPQESCNTAPKPKSKKKRKYRKRKRESTKLEKKRVHTTKKRTRKKR